MRLTECPVGTIFGALGRILTRRRRARPSEAPWCDIAAGPSARHGGQDGPKPFADVFLASTIAGGTAWR